MSVSAEPVRDAARPLLEVLVCTFEDRLAGLISRLPASQPGIAYLICHQVPSGKHFDVSLLSNRDDLRYLRFSDRGLSRNRNHCLRHAVGRICLIADDDIEFLPGWSETVLRGFAARRDATFVTFALLDADDKPRRAYPSAPVRHDLRSAFGVCSAELAIDLDKARAHCVGFNEHLGIGTPVGVGEENVFLRDLMKQGGEGWLVPEPIVRHGPSTAGERMMDALDRKQVFSIGAMAFSRRGALSYLLSIKEAVRLSIHAGRLTAVPSFFVAFNAGVSHGRQQALDQISLLAR
jgi:hypothetical protein